MPDAPNVFTPPGWYTELEKERALARALTGGTPDMQDAGKLYLPKERGERDWAPDNEYQERLERSTLLPVYQDAIEGAIGRILAQPIQLDEDVPLAIRGQDGDEESGVPKVEGWAENIDLAGNNLDTFVYEALLAGMPEGGIAILTEHQPLPEGEDARPASDEARPYWVAYTANQILDAVPKVVRGKRVLWAVRLLEPDSYTGDDYGQVMVERVRVIRRGDETLPDTDPARWARWELWIKGDKGEVGLDPDNPSGFFLDANGVPFTEIPLRPLPLGQRVGFWQWRPAMLNLAYLNLKHWRMDSDVTSYQHVAHIAILKAKMDPPKVDNQTGLVVGGVDVTTMGPGRMVYVGANGDLQYEGVPPALLAEGRAMLSDLRADMARAARQAELTTDPGNATATETAIRTAASHVTIEQMAQRLKDCLESALMDMARYAFGDGVSGGSVKITTKPLPQGADSAKLQALREARQGDGVSPFLSLLTYWEALREAGILPDDFDTAEEMRRLMEEAGGPRRVEVREPATAPQRPEDMPDEPMTGPMVPPEEMPQA